MRQELRLTHATAPGLEVVIETARLGVYISWGTYSRLWCAALESYTAARLLGVSSWEY